MATAPDQLPDDMDALKAALIETRAKLSGAQALIEHLRLVIAKMKRAMFGPRSERSQRLLDQLELQLEELAAAAGEDETKARERRHPGRELHAAQGDAAELPRPSAAPAHRASRADLVPVLRRHQALQDRRGHHRDARRGAAAMVRDRAVREKFSCRSCEKITQPPAPFHAIARGFAGPSLLAMILVDKYANHQPLNRQSEQYAREGIELSVSTHGRSCRRLRGDADAALRADQGARLRRRAHPRRRHHRAGAGQDEDPDRADLDLCA